MALVRLRIQNFRNIELADIEFSSKFNFLIGANGSGKTSILEAIYVLGHGRTFRTTQADKVINHQQNEFIVHGRICQTNNQELALGISKNRQGNSKIRINGHDGHKMAELAQLIPIQLISPEGFTLLNGGPKYRRAFLDWGCFHSHADFFQTWSHFRRLLKQRNAALRQVQCYSQLRAWDQVLIPLATKISDWRSAYLDAIQEQLSSTCTEFLPEFSLNFSFQAGWDREISYAQRLERQFERDRMLTYTSVGPHKADLRIRVNNSMVEDTLSRGQLKLLMCALRLVQGEHLARQNGCNCLYLIDDFASELDTKRRSLLARRLKATGAQVFVSAINQDQITDMIDENAKLFNVKYGKIEVKPNV